MQSHKQQQGLPLRYLDPESCQLRQGELQTQQGRRGQGSSQLQAEEHRCLTLSCAAREAHAPVALGEEQHRAVSSPLPTNNARAVPLRNEVVRRREVSLREQLADFEQQKQREEMAEIRNLEQMAAVALDNQGGGSSAPMSFADRENVRLRVQLSPKRTQERVLWLLSMDPDCGQLTDDCSSGQGNTSPLPLDAEALTRLDRLSDMTLMMISIMMTRSERPTTDSLQRVRNLEFIMSERIRIQRELHKL
jgi:hypothetical protein